jgi:Protein of unknown function (DUF3551)
MKKKNTLLFLAVIATFPLSANAAPFCVQGQGFPAMCEFDDAAQCRTRARELNGQCILNAAEFKLDTRPAERYCVVDSSKTALCIYADRTSCEDEAVRKGAVCVEVYPSDIKDNPYQFDPARKY